MPGVNHAADGDFSEKADLQEPGMEDRGVVAVFVFNIKDKARLGRGM